MTVALRTRAVDAALALGVVAATATSVSWRPSPDAVATWWPAAGLAAALVVRRPQRTWPLVLLLVGACTTAATLLAGRPLAFCVLMGSGNALEALVVGRVLIRGVPGLPGPEEPRQVRVTDQRDYARLLVAAVLGALTMAAAAALATGSTGGAVWDSVRAVAPSHLAAVLTIVPLVLGAGRGSPSRRRPAEVALQSGLLALSATLALLPSWPPALAFLPLPLLVWAALRLPALVALLELGALAALATAATTAGRGPFAQGPDGLLPPLESGALVQAFVVCAAVLTVPTALASAQRLALTARLDAERELSDTVLDTTAAMIFVTDPAGTVLQCNATVARLTGHAREDVVGREFWDCPLIPSERTEIVRQVFADPDGSNVPSFREADVQTRDGDRLRVVWSNNVVRDARGEVLRVVCTATDVTAERSTSELVRHLLEAPVSTALVALDAAGRVVMVNHGAEELVGRAAEELVGRPVGTLVASGHPAAFLAAADCEVRRDRDGAAPDPETHDWTWVHADGGELVVSTTISVVTNGVGKLTGFLCVGRDVTEQRRSHAMLVAALRKERHVVERLQRLDAAKNDFVSTVSHELRTPTTSIVGYTEMLREGAAGPVTPGQEVMLDAISRNGGRLIAVASDLLTLAGLESSDDVEARRDPVDLGQSVRAARETVLPLLAGRDLTLEVDLPDGPALVLGDPGQLDRVVVNLLSNAVKFTLDGGRVQTRVHLEPGTVVLEVADTGVGIPAEEQDALFTKFFRSSTAQERAIPGTGLGLSIIHRIVTAHGGQVGVRSAHLEGTTFTVRLPALPDPVPPAVGMVRDDVAGRTGHDPAVSSRTTPAGEEDHPAPQPVG